MAPVSPHQVCLNHAATCREAAAQKRRDADRDMVRARELDAEAEVWEDAARKLRAAD